MCQGCCNELSREEIAMQMQNDLFESQCQLFNNKSLDCKNSATTQII